MNVAIRLLQVALSDERCSQVLMSIFTFLSVLEVHVWLVLGLLALCQLTIK